MGEVIGMYTGKLKRIRRELGLTQKQLGKLIEYSSTWISEAERDEAQARNALVHINSIRRCFPDDLSFKKFVKDYVSMEE